MLLSFLSTDAGKEFSARRLALQIQYKRLQARYQQIRSRYLLIVCAWCQQRIRWQRKKDACDLVHTSHGICPACVTRVLGELGVMAPDTPKTAHAPCVIAS